MKKFIARTFLLSIPLIIFGIAVVFYNTYEDPYGVIRGDMATQILEPNQHYLKMKHCIEHPKKYNAFLFGSSRVGKINVETIPDTNNWYNMSYSMATPYETLKDLEILLKNKIEIKQILIGLDNITYQEFPELHLSSYMKKPYRNKFNPYWEYFFITPSCDYNSARNEMENSKFYTKGAYEMIYESGNFLPNKKDEFIEKNKATHSESPVFDAFYDHKVEQRITEAIEEIKQIKNFCNTNKIEVVFFINPMYINTYLEAVSNDFLIFLKNLADSTEYYDFSGLNKISKDPVNYYEKSHYRPFIGDTIVSRIFNHNLKNKFLVNSRNIDSLIAIKDSEIIKFKDH